MKAVLSTLALAGLLLTAAPASQVAAGADIRVDVDAREISRSLLHARIELPATAGEFVVWYPKWIPGVHAPSGPSENIAGLRFETPKGDVIQWRRDDEEMNRFILTVPPNTTRVIAKLDYICNQPSVNSSGVDSFGNPLVGVINWNTVMLYPESAHIDKMTAGVRLQLPPKWRFGTALRPQQQNAEAVEFQPDTLRRVADSPLICGEYFRTIDLTGKNTPPTFLHVTSESEAAIQFDEKLIGQYRKLVAEAVAMFGGAPFQHYHFLLVCSDRLPKNGLEHFESSFNAVGEREAIDDKKRKQWPAYLLPHEFVHAWCGKYRRPGAMVTTNFHTPERTRLLWVYEGLTQYLGEVLTVRSGLLSTAEYIPSFTGKLDFLMRQQGRNWRPLDDTAASSWKLRAHSQAWSQLRRGQDYYDEGLLTWMEADSIIRQKTDGKSSLDDFSKKFFAPERAKQSIVVAYDFAEVVGTMKQVLDYDWETFFNERTAKPRPALGLEFMETLGYRLQYSAKADEYTQDRERDRKQTIATGSLGLNVADEGRINSVVPGSPADKAGLATGMVISGVNGRKYTGQRLKDAIGDSVARRKVELLLLDGDQFRNVDVEYADGPRYLELVRINDRPDLMAQVLKPVVKDEPKPQ
jgi:predicted metalloprotease with PDZ domain